MSSEHTQVRRLNAPDRDAIAQTLADYLHGRIIKALEDTTKTCLACEHWKDKEELCGFHNARPPARVIAFGCKDFMDVVPF